MRAADLTTLVDKAAAAKTELESNRVENMAARARKQARGEGRGKEMEAGDTGGSAPSELARALEVVEVEVARRIVPAERAVMLRRVSRSMRAAMEVIKPAGVIRVKRGQGEEEVTASLVRMMQWCRITALNLSGTGWRLGREGMERLAAVLGQCASLAHLNLRGNSLGAEGAGRLAAVLPQCASLAHLDLYLRKT